MFPSTGKYIYIELPILALQLEKNARSDPKNIQT